MRQSHFGSSCSSLFGHHLQPKKVFLQCMTLLFTIYQGNYNLQTTSPFAICLVWPLLSCLPKVGIKEGRFKLWRPPCHDLLIISSWRKQSYALRIFIALPLEHHGTNLCERIYFLLRICRYNSDEICPLKVILLRSLRRGRCFASPWFNAWAWCWYKATKPLATNLELQCRRLGMRQIFHVPICFRHASSCVRSTCRD